MRNILLDILKVIALVAMFIYHWYFYQFYLYTTPITYVVEIIGWLARFLFLFLFGYNFIYSKAKTLKLVFIRLKRLITAALLVTITSYIYEPSLAIYFGVLHFFIFSAFVLYFLRAKPLLIAILTLVSSLGFVFALPTADFNYLFFLGLHTADFASFDYFAFCPYFSFVGLGYLFAYYFKNHFQIAYVPNLYTDLCSFVAKRSLVLYLLHLPVIVLFDYMLK